LLEYVNQFMSQKSPAVVSAGLVLRRAEGDLGSRSVSARTHRVCGAVGGGVRVDADFTKGVAEPGFHEGACRRVERLTGRAQDLMYDGRGRCGHSAQAGGQALEAHLAPAAFRALPSHPGHAAAGTPALQHVPARQQEG
jgi:hypothetical protein